MSRFRQPWQPRPRMISGYHVFSLPSDATVPDAPALFCSMYPAGGKGWRLAQIRSLYDAYDVTPGRAEVCVPFLNPHCRVHDVTLQPLCKTLQLSNLERIIDRIEGNRKGKRG